MQRSFFTTLLLAGSIPLMAQQPITCSSTSARPRFCPADTRNGVILVHERSNGVCEQGSTWSYTKRGISVNGGCSADFQIGGSSNSNGGTADGGYQNYQNNNPNANQNNYPNGNNSQNGNNGYGNRQQASVEIPAGTRLSVRLEQTVSSSNANMGDLIPATIVNDVTADGQVVIPAGTPVEAKVMSAQGGPLDLRLGSVRVNGRRYQLSSSSIHDARDIDGAQNGNQGAGRSLGSLLGTIAGGSQLNSGSVYIFRLTSPARSTPDRR